MVVELEEDEALACLTALEYMWDQLGGSEASEREAHKKIGTEFQQEMGWNGSYPIDVREML